MHSIVCVGASVRGKEIIISEAKKVHHCRSVLRLAPGQEILVFDGQGKEYTCRIEAMTAEGMRLTVVSFREAKSSLKIKVTVACAIPKNTKMDDIVDKLTQLGVERIIPMETERVIVRLNKERKALKRSRWEKIAENASEQCKRGSVPVIEPVQSLRDVIKISDGYEAKLIPHLEGKRASLKDVFKDSSPRQVLLCIGPEGDFSPAEVEDALAAGFIPVSLGETVLRVDTAAVAVMSFIRFL